MAGGYGYNMYSKLPVYTVSELAPTEYGLYINGTQVPGTLENGKICVTYTDMTVAELNTPYSVATYVVIGDVEYKSETRANVFNPYTLVTQLAVNGTYNGVVVTTDDKEIAVYKAMVEYYEALQNLLNAQ